MAIIKKYDQENNPKRVIYIGATVILFFFVGLGGVAAFMPFGGAVIAPGTVKISQEKKTVQHLEGGIVDQILVKEGDAVKQGSILIRLSSSSVKSSVSLLKGRLASKNIEASRLQAQMNFNKEFSLPKELPSDVPRIDEIIATERAIFNQSRKSVNSRIEIQKARIKQFEEKIDGANKEILSNKEIIASIDEELKAKVPLMEEKYIDKSQILTLRRMNSERKGQEARLLQVIAESRENIQELKLSIQSLENAYREEAVQNLAKVREEIFQIEKQLAPQLDIDERLNIRAPLSGTVINLQIHSENAGVIRPGMPILDIVPENAELIIECSLRQDMITRVKIGQETRVQLGAFNRITTPPVNGSVSYISADTVVQRLPSGAETHAYMLNVKVDKDTLEKNKVWLSPGMPATCFIQTEKRTFLKYLMEPILLNLDHSLRETL